MKISYVKIAFLILCCVALGFEIWHFRHTPPPTQQSAVPARKNQPDFALLPAGEIKTWTKYLAPGSHPESWEPTVADIDDVEANLAQITALSNSDPDPNRHIEAPREYYRQYLAIAIDGKRSIYVNALCSVDQDPNWRKRLILIRDGGKCFWHALYDPSTRKFSDLTINGRA